MRIIVILILIFSCDLIFGQKCEEYDRNLFHMLPEDFPTLINCKDSKGRKQGLWIHYKIQHGSYDIPDLLEKGGYVDNYSYGKYRDDIKVGEWLSVANVHQIFVTRSDIYYYSEDTILITSEYADYGWNKSSIYYNADSSIIESISLAPKKEFPVCIKCDKKRLKNEECIMTYRNSVIKYFPFDLFDIEFDASFSWFKREMNNIDEKHNINK